MKLGNAKLLSWVLRRPFAIRRISGVSQASSWPSNIAALRTWLMYSPKVSPGLNAVLHLRMVPEEGGGDVESVMVQNRR